MSNLPAVQSESTPPATMPMDPEIQAKVVIHGDLSQLTPQQKIAYYAARCNAAGLDIRARPFEYIVLNQKLVLYATKQCTDLLTGLHGLTVQLVSHRADPDMGVYIAEARASFPSGRYVDDIGVTPIAGQRANELANAMMKACTKAKRRAVLNACGLGDVIDETELETVAHTPPPKPDNQSGYGQGMYASPEDTESYLKALKGFLLKTNDQWLNALGELCRGDIPDVVKELNLWQADNHLVKWCKETAALDPANMPDEAKNRQVGRFTAIVYHRSPADRKALAKEMERYAAQHWTRQVEALARTRPDLAPEIAERWGVGQVEDAADPEIDYEQLPDEPGASG